MWDRNGFAIELGSAFYQLVTDENKVLVSAVLRVLAQ